MIVSDLAHIGQQVLTGTDLEKALDFLRRLDPEGATDGRTEIDGQNVFALLQHYETITADSPKFEYHREYIDVQYIVSGEEIIAWAPAERMTVTEPYDRDKDICFGTVPKGQTTPVYLKAGQLAVFYPDDGHAPRLAATAPSPVFKIVVKVAAR